MSETVETVDGPTAVSPGRNGHWVKLGEAGVDSGRLAVTDPIFTNPPLHDDPLPPGSPAGSRFGLGVQFSSGFGDGGYTVWGWVADYGDGDTVDERIGQIVVTMIDAHDLAEWRDDHCPQCSIECTTCQGHGCGACEWQGRIDNDRPCK